VIGFERPLAENSREATIRKVRKRWDVSFHESLQPRAHHFRQAGGLVAVSS